MLPKDFWLYQWLDSYLIKSPQQAMRLLREPGTIPSLMQAAVEAAAIRSDVDRDIGFPLVAGSSLDLSGEVACQNFPCLKRQVDELFRSAWHYFDRIVITGPSPRYIVDLWVNSDQEYAQMVTESHLLLLLYLRNIGAESLLIFAEKTRRWCEDCGKLVLSEIGFHSPDAYDAYLQELTDRLVRECEFGPSEGGLFPAFTIYHPEFFDEPMDGVVRGRASARSLKKRKRSLIAEVVQNNVDQLITDIALALQWHSPLGSTIKFHRQVLRHNISGTEEAQVAFNLKLPVLRNVDPELLIRIRQEEAEHFIAFRRSLQLAIRERLKATSDKDPAVLAAEIQSEVIQPQLDNIARRLRAAQKLLVQKSATSVAVGVLTTTCGLLTANPLMVTTGVAATMTALPAVHKYQDDRRDITLSDMYFAWQAQKHAAEEH